MKIRIAVLDKLVRTDCVVQRSFRRDLNAGK